MARHWLSLLAVAVVCLAAAPAPAPLRTADTEPRSGADRPAPDVMSAHTEAAAAVAGVGAGVVGSEVRLPTRGEYAAAAAGVAAAVSLAKFYLPSQAEFDALARTDPVALLDACRRRAAQLHGYRATLSKHERVAGRLHDAEVIRTAVRAEPYAVLMIWEQGAPEVLGTATEGVLFVAGQNNGKMKVWRPSARLLPKLLDVHPTDVHSPARGQSRYAVTEGGLLHASERTYRAWSEAREQGRLFWRYDGTRPVPGAGGRVCHLVTRTCDPPTIDPFLMSEKHVEPRGDRIADASRTVTIMIDVETWLQVGTHIEGVEGQLVAEYLFRDIELNPQFPPDQFKPSAFRK